MAVYVDDMHQYPIGRYGRMKMCHMMADTTDELLEMADLIGVARKWIQNPGTDNEHFDIAKTKRNKAVAAGAVEVTMRQLAQWRIRKNQTQQRNRQATPARHEPETKANTNPDGSTAGTAATAPPIRSSSGRCTTPAALTETEPAKR